MASRLGRRGPPRSFDRARAGRHPAVGHTVALAAADFGNNSASVLGLRFPPFYRRVTRACTLSAARVPFTLVGLPSGARVFRATFPVTRIPDTDGKTPFVNDVQRILVSGLYFLTPSWVHCVSVSKCPNDAFRRSPVHVLR